ncbi:MAG: hypothetical protein OSA92_03960 [Pirellulaceae bacterium]|nr:hypothetical protein [Pirellulaceae bacterium]
MLRKNLHCAFYQSKQRLAHHLVIPVITVSKKFFDEAADDLWQDVSWLTSRGEDSTMMYRLFL